MRLPICLADAKIGVLCPRCESRLDKGEISKVDVEVSFMLVKAAKFIPDLDNITLLRAYEIDDELMLVLGSGDVRKLLSNPEALKKLKEVVGRKLWITEEGDERRFIEYLLYPLRVLTLNTVWLPDGSKMTRVIVSGRPYSKSPVDLEKVKKIIREIKGVELEIKFEKPPPHKKRVVFR